MLPLCSKQDSISEQYNGLVNDPANRLSEVAPTLEALRMLSKEVKGQLLLPRLAKIRKQNFDALHKGNLMLHPDHYGLAHGNPLALTAELEKHIFEDGKKMLERIPRQKWPAHLGAFTSVDNS